MLHVYNVTYNKKNFIDCMFEAVSPVSFLTFWDRHNISVFTKRVHNLAFYKRRHPTTITYGFAACYSFNSFPGWMKISVNNWRHSILFMCHVCFKLYIVFILLIGIHAFIGTPGFVWNDLKPT